MQSTQDLEPSSPAGYAPGRFTPLQAAPPGRVPGTARSPHAQRSASADKCMWQHKRAATTSDRTQP